MSEHGTNTRTGLYDSGYEPISPAPYDPFPLETHTSTAQLHRSLTTNLYSNKPVRGAQRHSNNLVLLRPTAVAKVNKLVHPSKIRRPLQR